jgi:ParB family chromosome partitioning protein
VIDAKGKGEKYEVVAGGRPLLALRLLAAGKKIKKDEPITCKLTTVENAVAASLTENVQREAMHPSDEFEAFARLIDGGKTVEDVAAAFGVSPLTVQRRMKLGKVAPAVLQDYRDGKANLEQLMVLALCDDHDEQVRIWTTVGWRERDAYSLRRLILGQEVNCKTHPVAKFVGIKAYEAAGGAIRRDLFADDDSGSIIDVELLNRLATEKVAKHGQKIRAEGWSWVEGRLVIGHEDTSGLGHARRTIRTLTKVEQTKLDKLAAKIDALDKQIDALDNQEDDAAQEKADRLRDELDALRSQHDTATEEFMAYSGETMQTSGALVGLDHNGKLQVIRGLIRPEDRKRAQAAARGATDDAEGDDDDRSRPEQKHSDALVRRLTAHKTLAIQLAMTQQQGVALRIIAHTLAISLIGEGWSRSLSSIKGANCWHTLSGGGEDVEASQSWAALESLRDRWLKRLAGTDESYPLANVLALSDGETNELLALCAGLSVNAVSGREGDEDADELQRALSVDMRNHWTATEPSYFKHIPKQRILEALAEALPDQDHSKAGKLKKDELAKHAESLLSATGWLPSPLRSPLRPLPVERSAGK